MPAGKPYGYDGATKGKGGSLGAAKSPTHVPTPTATSSVQALNNKLPANHNSGQGRLQAYKQGVKHSLKKGY